MTTSILHETALRSQLAMQSTLKPKGGLIRRVLAADLLLTALIDAFSILVIFLLMNFSSNGEILFINKGTELPKSSASEFLERNPVVKIEEGKIFLEEKALTPEGLIQALVDLRKKFSDARPNEEVPSVVTVQADRRLKYEALNQVVLACAHAGYSDIRFAVLMR